jgi:hypothetical protein
MHSYHYRKLLENLRSHINVRLVAESETIRAERYVAKSNYVDSFIINDSLTMLKLSLNKIRWTKPTAVGFSVLELSKHLMYSFHYKVMLPLFKDQLSLLFTDTDSLAYEIRSRDPVPELMTIKHLLDTSNYPPDHPLYSKENERSLGAFKDEGAGRGFRQFVGLRSKMYSLLQPDGKEKITAKGIKTSYAKKNLRHALYLKCLHDVEQTTAAFKNIRSHHHVLRTVDVNKIALSPYDDKRYLLFRNYHTLAYGHHSIIAKPAAALV